MGCTKYPILDDDFVTLMLGSCYDNEDRGLVTILSLTGMHISSLCALGPGNLIKQGSKAYLQWVRPKTNKTLQALIPKDYAKDICEFLALRRKTRQHYHALVKKIGERAGYEDVSPMTFRHNRCLRALTKEGYSIFEVPQIMGCTLDVAVRNYSKLREDQLSRDHGSTDT
ncbi:MAG: tyrosine-type recombinase/integrase [Methanomassiliicoccus sp.]|nr:tyrosine-type recombinase/integrase [Methanomassiliicoccus sp.]